MQKSKHNIIKRAHVREKIRLVNAIRAEDAELEIETIHTSDRGFLVFAAKDEAWHQWSFRKEELNNIFIQNLLGMNKDTYISMNSFKSPRKLISNLFGLNALWSDLDYYKTRYKNKTPSEMIGILSKNKFIKKIPPSMYIFSGKGIYAIWLLDRSAHAQKCLPIWNKLMSNIHDELKKYGADAKSVEPSHVLRLTGSVNTKTGNIAKIIKDSYYRFNPKRYSLDELAKLMLPELKYTKEEFKKILAKKRKSKKDKAACKTKSLYNIHSLNYARMQDLQRLVELREGQCNGYREQIIFLYRYWANCFYKDNKKALEEAKELNKMFTEPLNEKEVEEATIRAEVASEILAKKLEEYCNLEKKPSIKTFFKKTGCYIYSNKKLIEILDIQQNEMEHLSTIINTKEKNRRNKNYRNEWKKARGKAGRRNENGLTSREQAKFDKIYAILRLQKEGLNQSQIASKLGVTRQAISKLVKEIKENNLTLEKPINIEDKPVELLSKVTDTELNLMII